MSSNGPSKQDTTLGRVVVKKGFCTQEEVDECLAMQAELRSPRTLADLLLHNHYVTETQLERANGTVEETGSGSVQQIPGYQILSKLGAGAMATVFKARQIALDRAVAIKVLPKRMSDNPEFVERFYKEGKAAAKLNHPNIVGAVDVGEANGFHYFVMEFVEGQTVFDKLDRGERYSESDALNIMIQICRALVHAHAAGFIHRDVKPKNIMITPQGIAKLADMGLARAASDHEAALAEAGKAYGTPYYISPEQIRGELDIDVRADIYSLGATFYHMVTGRVPFDAASPNLVMHKHLKEELVPPDHIVASLTAGVGEIIEMAMAKKRKNRYTNAEDMLTDLERVARGEPPLIARKSYDLTGLGDLEKTGMPIGSAQDSSSGSTVGGRAADQHTIDIAPRPQTAPSRLADPVVLSLAGALLLAIIVIFIMIIAHR